MYDAKEYFDLVTVWIKGYPPINFEILIKRKQLELLQARDESQHEGILNQKVTIIIKTFRRHGCLQRLVKSIRKYHPNISIIIADDSPGNGIEKFRHEVDDSK